MKSPEEIEKSPRLRATFLVENASNIPMAPKLKRKYQGLLTPRGTARTLDEVLSILVEELAGSKLPFLAKNKSVVEIIKGSMDSIRTHSWFPQSTIS